MKYGDLNRALLTQFPELAVEHAKLKRIWGEEEPGPHVVFGDVLTPYLIDLLDSQQSESSVAEAFRFLEGLLTEEDPEITAVVGGSVLERLNDKRRWREKSREFMGPLTRQLAGRIEADWGSVD